MYLPSWLASYNCYNYFSPPVVQPVDMASGGSTVAMPVDIVQAVFPRVPVTLVSADALADVPTGMAVLAVMCTWVSISALYMHAGAATM